MHHLLPLKFKIAVIVVLAAVTAGVANLLGFDKLGLSVIVGLVELVVVYVLLQSWGFLARLPMIPRPAWMRIDLSGEWKGKSIRNGKLRQTGEAYLGYPFRWTFGRVGMRLSFV